jgi:hypothetical protein
VRKNDSRKDIDDSGLTLAAVSGTRRHEKHLKRGCGEGQRERRPFAASSTMPQLLDKKVDCRARRVVAGKYVRYSVLEHPRRPSAIRDHFVKHPQIDLIPSAMASAAAAVWTPASS